ncbi:MAG: divalent metal cation transporter [Mycolicibacterium sp.]|nr:divalent metal cation transporter [Mycobacterium sp.]MCB9416251.1 divalent metal cation transporter [Mycolicibacterium sp.]
MAAPPPPQRLGVKRIDLVTLTVRRARLGALLAVVGPGLLAGLSDDDPAGITTYSVLGADHGYQLLWVLLLSTVALVIFHTLAARMGVVTGQGLIGLVRQRYGVGVGGAVLAALVVANVGTTCAEFAGIAAGFELFGISRFISVPAAALTVSLLVLRGSFSRVEHFLLLLSAVFLAYVASGLLAKPDWGAALYGTFVPTMPMTGDAIAMITATLGTTLAPWGLSFMQSYAVDKKLRTEDLPLERVDVVTGAVLTGVIGFFVVVACAATLHRDGRSITDAADAAVALEPLAGDVASTLFAIGLIGAAFLAASILPLSTAYSVCEYAGVEAAVDDPYREAKTFYLTYGIVTMIGAFVVLTPDAPLVAILVGTQVLNAVLLIPLLFAMVGIARDRDLMGRFAISRSWTVVYAMTTAVVVLCVLTLGVTTILG